MREFARSFYKGKNWIKVSRAFMTSKNYICERCGRPAVICHHRIYLTPENIQDPSIAYDWNNLECLCIECHNLEHNTESRVIYSADGSIASVKDSREEREFKESQEKLDEIIKSLKERTSAEKNGTF